MVNPARDRKDVDSEARTRPAQAAGSAGGAASPRSAGPARCLRSGWCRLRGSRRSVLGSNRPFHQRNEIFPFQHLFFQKDAHDLIHLRPVLGQDHARTLVALVNDRPDFFVDLKRDRFRVVALLVPNRGPGTGCRAGFPARPAPDAHSCRTRRPSHGRLLSPARSHWTRRS